MGKSKSLPDFHPAIYYRLIAVWVLCEAMLGAIIHGFRIPVSGLVMGSAAIACICLLGWYAPGRGRILKATIVVAIFKMMLSPQAPPPAYIAVFFQGILGELLFRNRSWFRLSCILLAVLGLLESGMQRLIALTIIYGNDFWRAVNDFINGITKQKYPSNYSLWFATGYAMLHIITGLIVGWWIAKLPDRVEKWKTSGEFRLPLLTSDPLPLPQKRRKKKLRIGLLIIWILLTGLYIQSYYRLGTPILPSHVSLKMLLRSLIIVFAWIFVVGTVFRKMLHAWLRKKQVKSGQDIAEVEKILPAMRQLISASWRLSSVQKGWKRFSFFCKTVIVNTLSGQPLPVAEKDPGKLVVYILTGPVQTGKTTSLVKWSEQQDNVFGVLTPVVNGKRVFMNARNRQLFRMEANDDENEILKIGRFTFSKRKFERATAILRENMHQPGWLVIDEIGPMELNGEGFREILMEIIRQRRDRLLLVVREKEEIVNKVKQMIGTDVTVIRGIEEL